MINCQKCPNWPLVEKAREACLKCDPDAISHHGASHVQATDGTLGEREREDQAPSSGCTRLSPEDEDILRKAMTSLFGLDPIDLLLAQHLFAGRRLSSFDETMIRVSNRLTRYHGSPRAQAHAAKNRIAKAFPALAPVFKRLIVCSQRQEDGEAGDGIEGQLDADAVTPDLFEGLT